MTSAVANRGFFITPHIVKRIDNKPIDNPNYTIPKNTDIDPIYFEPVINGMQKVFEQKGGTAYYSQIEGLEICGKTGTVQNFIKVAGEKIELADHSIFIAFAPKENPKIVIAVFVENGGFGSTVAAPIASLMIEKYINNKIKIKWRETNVHDINLYEREYDKILELQSNNDL
jgi:penicillin-binding protein 2